LLAEKEKFSLFPELHGPTTAVGRYHQPQEPVWLYPLSGSTLPHDGWRGERDKTLTLPRNHELERSKMKVKYGTIIVKDMDESIQFYTDVMGFEVDSRYNPQPGVIITPLKGKGDAMIEPMKSPTDETSLYSLGMDVEDGLNFVSSFDNFI
jgi:hypothetical protein